MKFFDHKKRLPNKSSEKPLPLRTTIEVGLTILVIFLSSLLFFGVSIGKIDTKTVMISLLITYIALQYWLDRIVRIKSNRKPFIKK